MKEVLKKVEEFHNLFNLPVLKKEIIPSKERQELRYNLLKEELDELKKAGENNDLVEVADALGDILYVLAGSVLEYGMQDKIEDIFNKIHESNMTKACMSEKEADETINFYKKNNGFSSKKVLKNNKYLIIRDDGKVLKSINYKPVDIKKILGE